MRASSGCGHAVVRLLLCATAPLLPSAAFNVDVRRARVIAAPDGSGHFGFAVALLQEDNNTWVVVGAPRGCGRQGACHGAVYKCLAEGDDHPCTAIPLPDQVDRSGIRCHSCSRECSSRNRLQYCTVEGNDMESCAEGDCDSREGALAGWAIDVQDAVNGMIVHLQVNMANSYLLVESSRVLLWVRETANADVSTANSAIVLRALSVVFKNLPDYAPQQEGENFQYLGGVGFSVHFVRHSTEIIIGAPLALNGKGTVIRHTAVKKVETTASDSYSDFLDDAYTSIITPSSLLIEEINNESYFGYSLSSGKFLRSNKPLYVASAPRANSLRGKTNGKPFLIEFELAGSQIGEYFGYSLCVSDLNSDGLDDLIIGAPHHSLDHHHSREPGDEGRIYVFMNQDNGKMAEIGHQIMGMKQPGARFGISVASIGDLNGDGFPDVAVGAPYEGHGAVYIYHGSITGVQPHYAQRISALKIDNSLQGFGISISRGLDVDGNYLNDIAVGAYLSRNVVILKSRPIVRFQTSLTTNVGKMGHSADGFLRACINYTGIHVPLLLVAAVTLTTIAETGKVNLVVKESKYGVYSYFPELKPSSSYCNRFGLEIKEVSKGSSRPIEVKMDFNIALERGAFEKPQSMCLMKHKRKVERHPCQPPPMADPLLPNSIVHKLPHPTYCGEELICTTDIETRAAVAGVSIPFIIGSAKFMDLNLVIRNNRGIASLVQARISFPRVTPLRSIPQHCQELSKPDIWSNESLLMCEMAILMVTKEKRNLTLVFDLKNIPSGYDRLIFKITSTSAGEDLKPENNDQQLIIPLRTISDVSISGKSFQTSVHFYKCKHELKDAISFSHIYEAYTLGPSPLSLARIIFKVPTAMETSSGTENFIKVYHPQTYDGYPSITCSLGIDSRGRSVSLPHKNGRSVTSKRIRKKEYQNIMDLSSARKKRNRRETEDDEEISHLPELNSGELVADCKQPLFKCMMLHCVVGPVHTTRTRAVITIPMVIYPAIAERILMEKDLMTLHSSGEITAEDLSSSIQPDIHQPDVTEVSTAFFGKQQEFKFDTWILLISLLGGKMALFILVLFLFKAGFFNRKKKREQRLIKQNLVKDEAVDSFIMPKASKLQLSLCSTCEASLNLPNLPSISPCENLNCSSRPLRVLKATP